MMRASEIVGAFCGGVRSTDVAMEDSEKRRSRRPSRIWSLTFLLVTPFCLLFAPLVSADIVDAAITASPSEIPEGDTSVFTVTLTDDPEGIHNGAAVVVEASGSAVLGVDYSIGGGGGSPIQLGFGADELTQTITVTALNDEIASEGAEDITFTITECTWVGGDGVVGTCPTGSSATVTIVDTTPADTTPADTTPADTTPGSNPLSSLPGLTDNERRVARTVETLCPRLGDISEQRALTAGEQDLLSQCQALIGSSASNPGAAVQGVVAITPQQASAPRKLTTQVTGAQLDNITTRLMALRRGAQGISSDNLTVNVDGQSINGNTISSLIQQPGETGGGASADDAYEFERLGIFVNGNIDWGDKDRTSNEDGFDFKTLGISAGMDYRFLDGLVLGIAIGYGDTTADFDTNGGDLDAKAWSSTLYGTYYATDHFYLEGSATYGWSDFDQTRNISYGLLGTTRKAKADYDSNQYAFMFGAGYDFILGGGILDLYGRLRYMEADLDGYRERGASGLDLDIDSQEATSFKSILGINYTRSFSTAKAVLVPQGWVEWAHEFEDGDDQVSGVFANDPSRISFALATDKFDTDYFRLGLGLGAQFGKGRTAFVSYEAAIGISSYTEHTANLGVRIDL